MKKFNHPLQVAVGVVINAAGQVLIAQRKQDAHQGGLWEFPGGKLEPGESAEAALRRELHEELTIEVQTATPLITVRYSYPELSVQLIVFKVTAFSGEACSGEGQPIRWVELGQLGHYRFPDANQPIIKAAQLPGCYAILDEAEPHTLMSNLQRLLQQDLRLIQARLKKLPTPVIEQFIEQAYPLCQQHGGVLLINSAAPQGLWRRVDGVHLTQHDLMRLRCRPTGLRYVSASCHTLDELRHAEAIGVDFAVLSPVLATQSHPDAQPLGWETFTQWVAKVNCPVYALGGMRYESLLNAQHAGAQGIAAIRGFLSYSVFNTG